MPPPPSLLSLSVVSGRVVRHHGVAVVFVEFEADALPSPGALLRDPDTLALVEVIGPDNPTEVRAVTRRGPQPGVGVCLDLAPDPPDDSLTDLDHVEPGHHALLAPQPTPNPVAPPTLRHLATGHPGLDVLAPCAQGLATAWRGDDLAALRRLARQLAPTLLDQLGPDARGLWVSAAPLPAPLPDRWTALTPTASNQPGTAAIALRSANRWAASIPGPCLVVWDDPEAALEAWMATDATLVGPAAGTLAMRHASDLLANLLTASSAPRALLGLLPGPETGRHLPGTIDLGVERLFTVIAEFSGDRLQLREVVGVEALPETCVSRRHLQTVRALQDVLGVALEVGDHARIFGEIELTEAQREILAVAAGLEAYLSAAPEEAVGLAEALERCRALIQGE